MSSEEPEPLFRAYRDAICAAVGTGTTSTMDLDRLGKRLMPDFFRGTFARGREPPPDGTRHCLIVNTSRLEDRDGGQHWLTIYREPGFPDLVHDSYGRGAMGFRGRGTERDVEQGLADNYCGQGAVAFGLVCQRLGQEAFRV